MNTTFQKLDNYLRELRPDFYKKLNAPLDDADIKTLEEKYNRQLPDDLKHLYKWKNGQDENSSSTFVNNGEFITLENALDTAAENTSMIGSDFDIENWWNEGWIPLFHNGGGDYICYDTNGTFTGHKGQLVEFWHADNDRNVIAPSLEAFLEKLNAYFSNVPPEKFDSIFEVEAPEGYPKKFIVE